MGPTKSALQYTCSGCYPKKMNGKQEEIHNILVALLSGKEEEIYNVLYKKKEIDDKSPKLRTEDEEKKLKSLSYKMRKFPKDLIDDIKKKFPFLQRTPKTAEQRKEKQKEYNEKRSAQSDIEKERRLNKQKEYDHEKRFAESEIEKERRLTQDKEYHSQKRCAEGEIEKERRLNTQKEYEHEKRF